MYVSFPIDITLTCRALNLLEANDESNNSSVLLKESFRYLVRVYYMIIWAFLFQHDYAYKVLDRSKTVSQIESILCPFKIERTDTDATNTSEDMNGN